MDAPQFIPVKVAAKRLGCHVETLRRALRAGTLPGKKVSGEWLVGATRLDRLEYVARKLDVTVETLRESLRAGTLPGVKIGSMWCVDPEQIVLALNRSAEQPPFGQPAGVGGIRHVAKIPQYVPIKEVARKLDVHVETLRRMLRSNELPGTKVHNVWRVDPEQIVLALSRSANK